MHDLEKLFADYHTPTLYLVAGQKHGLFIEQLFDKCAKENLDAWARPEWLVVHEFFPKILQLQPDWNEQNFFVNQAFERFLWEDVIQEWLIKEELFLGEQVVYQAQDARRTLAQYGGLEELPDKSWWSQDGLAFLQWHDSLNRILEHHQLWDGARCLSDVVSRLKQQSLVCPWKRIVVAPQAPLPQYLEFVLAQFSEIGAEVLVLKEDLTSKPHGQVLAVSEERDLWDNIKEELVLMSSAQECDKRVLIVVPGLDQKLTEMETFFLKPLEEEPNVKVHCGLGPALSDRPFVAGVCLLLELCFRPLSWNELSTVLRWLDSLNPENRSWAKMELALEDFARYRWTLDEFKAGLELVQPTRQENTLEKLLVNWRDEFELLRGYEDWAQLFKTITEQLLSLRSLSLDSQSFQVVRKFYQILREFSQLYPWREDVSGKEAFTRLKAMLRPSRFRPKSRNQQEDKGLSIDISQEKEIVGYYDKVYVIGCDSRNFPPQVILNPLIPIPWQREKQVDLATSQSVQQASERFWSLVYGMTKSLVLGVAKEAEGSELIPCQEATLLPDYSGLETRKSWDAQPLLSYEVTSELPALGTLDQPWSAPRGTRGLSLMAKCPMWATVEVRWGCLRRYPLPLGLAPRVLGDWIHDVLECFWQEVGSLSGLIEFGEPARAQRVQELTAEIRKKLFHRKSLRLTDLPDSILDIEEKRVVAIVLDWLSLELEREGLFTVIETESQEQISLGGLTLKVRLDRVDQLEDGSLVVIDYKSGNTGPGLRAIDSRDPQEPQLLLYAVTRNRPVSGILFGRMQTQGPRTSSWVGYGKEALGIQGFRSYEELDDSGMIEFLEESKNSVTELAIKLAQGFTTVQPQSLQLCDQCSWQSVCRIREKRDGKGKD